jgi:dihydroceramidase
MCISLHFFFVAAGFELMGTKNHRIVYYAKWIPYVQLVETYGDKKVE